MDWRFLLAFYILINICVISIFYEMLIKRYGWKFKFFIAWFDLWFGFYWDKNKKILYYNPLPTVVFSFSDPSNEWINGKWELKE